jgi:hypothetical protein
MSQGRTGSVQLKQLTQEGWRLPPLLHFNKDSHNQGFCVVVAATDSAGCAKSYALPNLPNHRKRGDSVMIALDNDRGVKYISNTDAMTKIRLRSSFDLCLTNSARRVLDVLIAHANADGTVEMSFGTLANILGFARPCGVPIIRRLIECGYITKENVVDANGTPLPNLYRLRISE